jgi:hypothetical protein
MTDTGMDALRVVLQMQECEMLRELREIKSLMPKLTPGDILVCKCLEYIEAERSPHCGPNSWKEDGTDDLTDLLFGMKVDCDGARDLEVQHKSLYTFTFKERVDGQYIFQHAFHGTDNKFYIEEFSFKWYTLTRQEFWEKGKTLQPAQQDIRVHDALEKWSAPGEPEASQRPCGCCLKGPHIYNCSHARKCSECGCRLEEGLGVHQYACSHARKCSECGCRLEEGLGVHQYACSHARKCSECGCRLEEGFAGVHQCSHARPLPPLEEVLTIAF